jgi:hypothetical protein
VRVLVGRMLWGVESRDLGRCPVDERGRHGCSVQELMMSVIDLEVAKSGISDFFLTVWKASVGM